MGAAAENVVPVDFRSAPTKTTAADAASLPNEVSQRIAAEAQEQLLKLGSDKKAGVLKTLAVARGDQFQVNPYLLKIKPDWNSRDANDPANEAHIDDLARSIAASGVWQPLTVIVEDDEIFVTDGHCRLFGTKRAIEVYGAEVKSIPVRGERKYGSEGDRILGQIVRNSGKPLTVMEQGAVFIKLIAFGWSVAQIAEKAGLSAVRISQVLDLMEDATDTIKSLVSSGAVSASTAAAAIRSAGGGKAAEKTLKEAVAVAKAAGKTRATAKHIAEVNEGPDGKIARRKEVLARLAGIFGDAEITPARGTVTIELSTADWKTVKEALNIA